MDRTIPVPDSKLVIEAPPATLEPVAYDVRVDDPSTEGEMLSVRRIVFRTETSPDALTDDTLLLIARDRMRCNLKYGRPCAWIWIAQKAIELTLTMLAFRRRQRGGMVDTAFEKYKRWRGTR